MEQKPKNNKSKRAITGLFDRLQNILANNVIGKLGTNNAQAKQTIEKLNTEINTHFGTSDVYKIRLRFDVTNGNMLMLPNNIETEKIFDLYWKFASKTSSK